MGCHSWHGKGGGGYGAGVSLRNIDLTLNEIINVIKYGRPGTGMPYFLKKAYKEEKCYNTTFEDYDGSYRPVSSKKFLSPKTNRSSIYLCKGSFTWQKVRQELL